MIKFTVIRGKKEISLEAEGQIRYIEDNKGVTYYIASFDPGFFGLVTGFQQTIKSGDRCIIECEERRIEGQYVLASRIDGNPIRVFEKSIAQIP